MTEPCELVLTPPAVRAVQSGLPEAVAAAVIEFVTGALLARQPPARRQAPTRRLWPAFTPHVAAPIGCCIGSTTSATRSSFCVSTIAARSTAPNNRSCRDEHSPPRGRRPEAPVGHALVASSSLRTATVATQTASVGRLSSERHAQAQEALGHLALKSLESRDGHRQLRLDRGQPLLEVVAWRGRLGCRTR